MATLTVNPYKNANWNNQFKANLHTHADEWGTDHSELSASEVIDLYHQAGYDILAITEHTNFVWPWEDYNRSATDLGMIAIKGCELYNQQHHTLCLYESINNTQDFQINNDPHEGYDEMEGNGASGILAHPRYPTYPSMYSLNWYVETYTKYPFLFGAEIFNPRYAVAEDWWDEVLSVMMPHRPVWGFANDDMHRVDSDFDQNKSVILAQELTDEAVKHSLQNGESYFVTGEPTRKTTINEIIVDEENKQITIDAEDVSRIEWVSTNGRIIHIGDTLHYDRVRNLGNYARARILGRSNNAYTQPFGFVGGGQQVKTGGFRPPFR